MYRNTLEALQSRYSALAVEVAERTRERDEAKRLLEEARAQTKPIAKPRSRAGVVVVLAAFAAFAIGFTSQAIVEHQRFEHSMQNLSHGIDGLDHAIQKIDILYGGGGGGGGSGGPTG